MLPECFRVLKGALEIPRTGRPGRRVDCTVANQWRRGFGATMTLTSLGDTLTARTLTWPYSAGQQVTQARNAAVTQGDVTVTARNAAYDGTVATGGTAWRRQAGQRPTAKSDITPTPGAHDSRDPDQNASPPTEVEMRGCVNWRTGATRRLTIS